MSELPCVSGRASLDVSFASFAELKSINILRCLSFDILYFYGPEGVLLRLTLSKGWEDILFNALDKELQEEYRKVIPITTELFEGQEIN